MAENKLRKYITRRLVFQVATCMMLVLILTFGLRNTGNWLAKVFSQRRIVEIVEEHGGQVYYRHQVTVDAGYVPLEECAPKWVVLTPTIFSDIVDIDLAGTTISDDEIDNLSPHLQQLPQLGWIDIRNTRITVEGWQVFSKMRSKNCKIRMTDEQVRQFRQQLDGVERTSWNKLTQVGHKLGSGFNY